MSARTSPPARRHRQHAEGDDRTHGVVECGLAHHGLRHAVADMDLAENRHQRGRVGRGQRCAEQQRHDHGNAEDIVAARPVMTAVMRMPTVAITTMVIQTRFRTLKRSDAPPSNRM